MKILDSTTLSQHCSQILRRTIACKMDRKRITWPARSPDLTPFDFFRWGFVKDQVYRTPASDLLDLQERIYAAVNNVTPQILHNTWVEVEYRLDISRATNASHLEVHWSSIGHSVLPKNRSFTTNSVFSTLPSSQPYFSYFQTVHLLQCCLSSDIFFCPELSSHLSYLLEHPSAGSSFVVNGPVNFWIPLLRNVYFHDSNISHHTTT